VIPYARAEVIACRPASAPPRVSRLPHSSVTSPPCPKSMIGLATLTAASSELR